MRRGNEPTFLKNEAGKIFAINLGADFCAEHEWGIENLHRVIGADGTATGLARYTASRPCIVTSFVVKKKLFIIFDQGWYSNTDDRVERLKKYYGEGKGELYIRKPWGDEVPETLGTAWSDSDFGIVISKSDKEGYEFGLKLVKAIEDGNFSLWLSKMSNNPFENAGLKVGITSEVPAEYDAAMTQAHVDAKKLADASDATGIHILLRERGKKHFACAPRWKDISPKVETKYDVIYWLNPTEQNIHNYGWFTVEDLTDWANGVAGNKIDMTPEQIAKRKA